MRVLAIIPARAGSKRIPGKNRRLFFGKPLIQWTIDAAVGAKGIAKIVVSTDDAEILSYKSLYPSVDFYRRPDDLCTDLSSSSEVVLDVLVNYDNSFDSILLLQPTSPFRDSATIERALVLASETSAKGVVSVRRCHDIPSHIMVSRDGYLKPLLDDKLSMRSQDWGNLWVLNGALYFSDRELFLKAKSFLNSSTIPFEMDTDKSIDIDTEEDWVRAEKLAQIFMKSK